MSKLLHWAWAACTPSSSPFGTFREEETSPAARSEEKRLFLQATFAFAPDVALPGNRKMHPDATSGWRPLRTPKRSIEIFSNSILCLAVRLTRDKFINLASLGIDLFSLYVLFSQYRYIYEHEYIVFGFPIKFTTISLHFFWVKPHTVFHTIIMCISNSKIQQATRVAWYYFKKTSWKIWAGLWTGESPVQVLQLALQKRSYHQHTSFLSASHLVVY